jgi:uroporphyrinogen-III synthase
MTSAVTVLEEQGVMSEIFLLKNRTVPKDPYYDILRSSSYSPVFIPLLNHLPINEPETLSLLTSEGFLSGTNVIIITSQRAVESLSLTLSKLTEDVKSQIFQKIAYTVGPATFKILSELGFKNVRGGEKAGNGDILSDIILQEIDSENEVIFFTGEIRRDIIPRKLSSNGILVNEIVIYKTEERSGIIDDFIGKFNGSNSENRWVIFFSPQGTSDIVDHLKNNDLSRIKIGSIGPTTEKYLIENGIKVDFVSKKPDPENLFNGITDA